MGWPGLLPHCPYSPQAAAPASSSPSGASEASPSEPPLRFPAEQRDQAPRRRGGPALAGPARAFLRGRHKPLQDHNAPRQTRRTKPSVRPRRGTRIGARRGGGRNAL